MANPTCDVPGCERPGVHPVERFGEEDKTVLICDRCWEEMCNESNACEMEEP